MKKVSLLIISIAFLSGCASHELKTEKHVDGNNLNSTSAISKSDFNKEVEVYRQKLIAERIKKTPVKKGSNLYCKVSINNYGDNVDSTIKAYVKDDISFFKVKFSNGNELDSPEMIVSSPESGIRTGGTESDGMTFIASYDGLEYAIDVYGKRNLTQILGWKYLVKTEYNSHSYRINIYDCKKVK
ncbi:hypothetical protein [Phytobacter diazotrophicus]|uniref:hypothetical protein n=1 Tax=Phytobacter diazotrophicus TaxID=395631 RepID=UPI002FFA9996